ncbi:MAG: DUF1772 domain-containing protein [Thermoleophilaceae bacterium]|nr:DUF1772 domain-containing protein [Thermoleophilaceae bacterium]
MTETLLLAAATLLAGSLAGMELCSWGVVHPALGRLDHLEEIHAEKAMYRRFGIVQAPQMAATVTVATLTAVVSSGQIAMYAGIASACLAGMLVLTFAGNMPINVAVLGWEEPGDPNEWRRLRRRWDAIHTVRTVLDSAAFVLLVIACLHA